MVTPTRTTPHAKVRKVKQATTQVHAGSHQYNLVDLASLQQRRGVLGILECVEAALLEHEIGGIHSRLPQYHTIHGRLRYPMVCRVAAGNNQETHTVDPLALPKKLQSFDHPAKSERTYFDRLCAAISGQLRASAEQDNGRRMRRLDRDRRRIALLQVRSQ